MTSIYTVWYKETPKSNWVLFKECNTYGEMTTWLSALKSILNNGAVIRYF